MAHYALPSQHGGGHTGFVPRPDCAARTSRQAVHRRVAIPEHEWRSRTGVLRGRHRRRTSSPELSRYPDLFVTARNSSFAYRGRAVRIADVARELGVRYVVEGSVRRGGSRVRITAQLIDALSDKHLWAQRYDRELQDVFAIQDDVTSSIVAVLPARIEAAATEAAARKSRFAGGLRPHVARKVLSSPVRRKGESGSQKQSFDQRSTRSTLRLLPTLGRPARSPKREFLGYRDPAPKLSEIACLVEAAARLDESDTECHRIMCRLALLDGLFAKSEYHLERAMAQNPNDPRLVAQRGINLTYLGDPVKAIPVDRTGDASRSVLGPSLLSRPCASFVHGRTRDRGDWRFGVEWNRNTSITTRYWRPADPWPVILWRRKTRGDASLRCAQTLKSVRTWRAGLLGSSLRTRCACAMRCKRRVCPNSPPF